PPSATTAGHGGSAIALERDAVVRRPAPDPSPAGEARRDSRLRLGASPPLPAARERDRLIALPRAPGSLFAYWEISAERRSALLADLATTDESQVREVLRARLLDA